MFEEMNGVGNVCVDFYYWMDDWMENEFIYRREKAKKMFTNPFFSSN